MNDLESRATNWAFSFNPFSDFTSVLYCEILVPLLGKLATWSCERKDCCKRPSESLFKTILEASHSLIAALFRLAKPVAKPVRIIKR